MGRVRICPLPRTRVHQHRRHSSPHDTTVAEASRNTIALVGNPNVGKSVVFGYLTGSYVNVSNYPGTTVEVTQGRLTGERNPRQRGAGWRHSSRATHQESHQGKGRLHDEDSPGRQHGYRRRHGDWEVIDTPGVNNFIPTSEDEVVTRNILMNETPSRIIQIADAKNIRRGLLLSLQLSEMGLPYTLCLNMTDEARDRGIQVDSAALSETLGVPVIDTIATQKVGLEEARRITLGNGATPRSIPIEYPAPIREAIEELVPLLPASQLSAPSLAIMLLTADET
ncbi:MAG: 50S ribosome-binding GTPase, partial [Fidelibacterota bacterium]